MITAVPEMMADGVEGPARANALSRHYSVSLTISLNDFNLIYVTPHPTLSRFYRLYDRVLGSVKMLGRMLVFRGIAASHMTTFAAKTQMHPGITRFQAFLTTVRVWSNVPYMVQMRTP
jgi:hypothetical protein